jgi:hypothetical protein
VLGAMIKDPKKEYKPEEEEGFSPEDWDVEF